VTPANPSGLRLPNPSGHLDDEYLQEDLPVVSFAESPADMANVRWHRVAHPPAGSPMRTSTSSSLALTTSSRWNGSPTKV